MIQDKFATGMYIVDKDFRILNVNSTMKGMYPSVKVGDICYKTIAHQPCQCQVCPLVTDDSLFYNPITREWISANAALIDYPGHGECYNVQFHIRQSLSDAGKKNMQDENMDEHIIELSGGTLDACAIGGYCEPGSPLAYANEQMIRLMGYDSVEEMSQAVDGLVFNTIHPEDVDRVTADLTQCALQGGSFETTYRMRRKDRSWLWIVARGKRIQSASGVYILFCVITDMSEFMHRQQELKRQNEALVQKEIADQTVWANIPCGYHRCSVDNGFLLEMVSDSFLEAVGYAREEALGKPYLELVYPEDRALFMSHEPELVERGKVELVYRIVRKDGEIRWVKDCTMRIRYNGKDAYQCILVDITEHVETLHAARMEAEASNQAKSAFLFNASHDIRTPMNAIQGFSHIIKQNADNPQMVLETVEKLQRSGNVLLTLLNDVLELSRIEQGKDTVNRRPLNMQAHVEKLHEMMVQEMAHDGITFRVVNRIQHPFVMADELKLTRIAMNFLSNAKKFTPAGGTVTFGVQESEYDGERAVYTLYVKDTGIGMSKEFQEHAFEQFERERTSTVSGVSGSGLGLSITKKLADLVGGKCTIDSELGRGTTMTCAVRLSLASESDFRPKELAAEVDFHGMRILLVEDNEFNREIARYVFEAGGFQVEEAANGVECLEKLNSMPMGHFNLILMDIQMPVMDGYTATQEIRRHRNPIIRSIPIIAMTANAFEEDRRRCLSIGMDGHIGKPLEAQAVLEELSRVILKGGAK